MSAALDCRHFGDCGGCDRLDVPYPLQLARKRDEVAALLAPWLAGKSVECEFPPQAPRHARTKLSWPVRAARDGRAVTGMFRRGSHELIAIEECRLQDQVLTRWQKRAQDVLRLLRLPGWDEVRNEGVVRALHARLMPKSGELLFGVTTSGGVFPQGRALAEGLLECAKGLRDHQGRRFVPVGVVRSILDEPGNALLGSRHLALLGKDHQIERSGGIDFRVSFASFWQSHRDADTLLYREALAMLGDVAGCEVVDGYGGVGAFGLRLAKAGAKRTTIVENHGSACADARWSAQHAGLGTVKIATTAFDDFTCDAPVDVAVVDPPRKGLGDGGVAALARMAAKRLLYVACSPQALARDLAGLSACGYSLNSARVVDLFPHTEHVEVVAVLARA